MKGRCEGKCVLQKNLEKLHELLSHTLGMNLWIYSAIGISNISSRKSRYIYRIPWNYSLYNIISRKVFSGLPIRIEAWLPIYKLPLVFNISKYFFFWIHSWFRNVVRLHTAWVCSSPWGNNAVAAVRYEANETVVNHRENN